MNDYERIKKVSSLKNKSVELVRFCALMIVLVYHAWVLCGSTPISNTIVNIFVILGGEIGVTAFFVLSGFGIYYSINRMEKRNEINAKEFFLKRAKRIVPHYYLSIIVVLLIGNGGVYLSKNGIGSIVTHLLFLHNLFPQYHGTINGVLWTMGVIVQFYILAIPLYKVLKKFPKMFVLLSIVFTVCTKWYIYSIWIPSHEYASGWSFVLGRQIYSALDNFTVGMFVAFLSEKYRNKIRNYKILNVFGLIFGIVGIYFVCRLGVRFGIHTNNFSGYVWHSVLAVMISWGVFCIAHVNFGDTVLLRPFIYIAECEYGIYLWHLVIFYNLLNTEWVQILLNNGMKKVVYVLFIGIAVLFGIIFSELMKGLPKRQLKNVTKE